MSLFSENAHSSKVHRGKQRSRKGMAATTDGKCGELAPGDVVAQEDLFKEMASEQRLEGQEYSSHGQSWRTHGRGRQAF